MASYNYPPEGSGGSGSDVTSVNGQTGVVILDTQDLADIPFITVLPSAGSAGIQAAVDAASSAGGGIVQLLEGTYVCPTAVVWGTSTNNVIVKGIGQSTIISVTIPLEDPPTNPWMFDMLGGYNEYGIGSTTQGLYTFTTTTAADAANFVLGDYVVIEGTDVDGLRRLEDNYVVSSDGSTGIVTLKSSLNLSLTTSVTATRRTAGFNNGLQDLTINHDAGAAHSVGIRGQVGSFCRNVFGNGKLASGGDGFTMADCSDCVIDACVINGYNVPEYYPTILDEVYGDSVGIYDVLRCEFINNHILDSGNVANSNTKAIRLANVVEQCGIDNNIINAARTNAINISTTTSLVNSSINNNQIINTHLFPIFSSNSAMMKNSEFCDNLIFNSHESTSSFWPGITFTTPSFAKYLKINGNKILGTAGEGFNLGNVNYSDISNNISRNTNSAGIYIVNSDNNSLVSNICMGNANAGIYVDGCDKNTIVGNTCNDNTVHGIRLDGTCVGTVISGNSCTGNGTNPLLISNASSNVIAIGNNFDGVAPSLGSGTNINATGNL